MDHGEPWLAALAGGSALRALGGGPLGREVARCARRGDSRVRDRPAQPATSRRERSESPPAGGVSRHLPRAQRA